MKCFALRTSSNSWFSNPQDANKLALHHPERPSAERRKATSPEMLTCSCLSDLTRTVRSGSLFLRSLSACDMGSASTREQASSSRGSGSWSPGWIFASSPCSCSRASRKPQVRWPLGLEPRRPVRSRPNPRATRAGRQRPRGARHLPALSPILRRAA